MILLAGIVALALLVGVFVVMRILPGDPLVAIFGPDHRLKSYNAAYRALFDLDPAFLDSAPDEMAIIEGRAAENNIPLSDFVREQALSGAILVRKSRTLSAIDRHDLARIGSNLNQIARACNATGDTFRARHIESILDELRRLLRRIDAPGQAPDELGEG